MSYKPTPITARILKTTKGGITQPILNMGAPVKMKMSSPAKQGGKYNKRTTNVTSTKSSNTPKDTSVQKDSGKKNISFKEYRESGKMDPSEAKYYKGSGTKRVSSDFKAATAKDLKARSDGEAGRSKDDAARKNNTGKHTKITGKIGSDLRRKQYKEKGYANDDTTMKSKAKAVDLKPAVVKDVKPKSVSIEAKLDPRQLKAKTAKVNSKKEVSAGAVRESNRKNASADRKESRAARVAQKAKEAKDSGNTDKADRLKRREARITKRANKKRGQAERAIQPK